MTLRKYPHLKFAVLLGIGSLVALVLCVQCVRTYLYTDSVLVPQQADREAERQMGALAAAARSAGVSDASKLGPVVEHTWEAASDRLLWIRVLDGDGSVLAQAGHPQGTAKIPAGWWQKVEAHNDLSTIVETNAGKTLVAMLPFHLHPPRPMAPPAGASFPNGPGMKRFGANSVEVAIPLKAVRGQFEGLRQNLIVGVAASIILLLSLAIIALRATAYLRGRYLESELRLAKRVQSDLRPKPQLSSANVQFAASAVAADHVGGDFYDVFEVEPGKTSIVLGDVSGKGIPAALLVSVLQGAIRSSTGIRHDLACQRINRMLCERTACERFATLFWAIFDRETQELRYVNAGHAAPMLVRKQGNTVERLSEGGPVLGLLPNALYSAGTVLIGASDRLILYSDGIDESANQQCEEFGEQRIIDLVVNSVDEKPDSLCQRIIERVGAFSNNAVPSDDQTLLVVQFSEQKSAEPVHPSQQRDFESVALKSA